MTGTTTHPPGGPRPPAAPARGPLKKHRPENPRKRMALITGLVLSPLVLLLLLFTVGFELLITHLPADTERAMGDGLLTAFQLSDTEDRETVQALLDRMLAHRQPQKLEYTVHVQESPDVNAVSLPGGHIVVFRGLLDQVESENELAMVLGHELGHTAHHHHLRGFGRALLVFYVSTALLGEKSSVTLALQDRLARSQAEYSQDQERESDTYGLHLLHDTYGHVAGATDFFERLAAEASAEEEDFLATHPAPAERVVTLEARIAEHQYLVEEKEPLPWDEEALQKKRKKKRGRPRR